MGKALGHGLCLWLAALCFSAVADGTRTLAAYTPVKPKPFISHTTASPTVSKLPISLLHPVPDKVLVQKAQKKLQLLHGGNVIKEYPIALGKNPVGHKKEEGDGRTPEGKYVLDWRKKDSKYYRAIHISYPNEEDIAQAEAREVDPGGYIMIHGSPSWVPSSEWARDWLNKEDWTEGCIAVTNDIMDEIWQLVQDGTPIEIRP